MTTPQSDVGGSVLRSLLDDSSPTSRTIAPCHDDVCITCSDLAVAVRIISLHGDGLAMVDTGESIEEVSVALVDVGVGDTVLVHAKEAITVVDSS